MGTREQLEARRSLHQSHAREAREQRNWRTYLNQMRIVAEIDQVIARLKPNIACH